MDAAGYSHAGSARLRILRYVSGVQDSVSSFFEAVHAAGLIRDE